MLVTLDRYGRFLRMYWPGLDHRQTLGKYGFSVLVGGISQSSDVFEYNDETIQRYIDDTNVLKTDIIIRNKGVKVSFTDHVDIEHDNVIRRIDIENISNEDKTVEIICRSSIQSYGGETPCSYYDRKEMVSVHYLHGHYMASGLDIGVDFAKIGDLSEKVSIGMMPSVEIRKELGIIPKGERREFTQFFCFGKSINELRQEIEHLKSMDYSKNLEMNVEFWQNIVRSANRPRVEKKVLIKVYNRSVLLFHLISDSVNGGILASAEVDEGYTRCGRYAYCWGRDAAFITEAYDACGLGLMSEKFYNWAEKTQEADGSWQQRYHTDGDLAPCWGFQADETGSIIYGAYRHYLCTGDKDFLKSKYDMIKRAAAFLVENIDTENGFPKRCYDLWEERVGVHAYTNAAVYAGLKAAADAAEILGSDDHEKWRAVGEDIKEKTISFFWKEEYKRFIRSIMVDEDRREDWKFDVSLLGITWPFEMLDVDDDRIKSTFGFLERMLRDGNTGLHGRYEDDRYIGGNPWTLSSLWIAAYLYCGKEYKKAGNMLENVLKYRTEHDLLPEQIDRNTGEPAWVIPLTWSHALFVLLLFELSDKIDDWGEPG